MFLGMRVRTLAGVKTLIGFGPRIDRAGAARPDGLLHYENGILFSLRPLHVGMRWYWRDYESLEAWSQSKPHSVWWRDFLRDSGGTGFWHETFFMRGGMEAVYDDVTTPIGFGAFLPMGEPKGPMSKRVRARGIEPG